MGTSSHTAVAVSIRASMKIIEKEDTAKRKKDFFKRMHPLNPYTRQGCPFCPRRSLRRQFVVANTRHYTMGRCIETDKHMIQNYGITIAAWTISQSCLGTWIKHDLHIQNAMKHTLVAAQSKTTTTANNSHAADFAESKPENKQNKHRNHDLTHRHVEIGSQLGG